MASEQLKNFIFDFGNEIDYVTLDNAVDVLLAKTNTVSELLLVIINSHKLRQEYERKLGELLRTVEDESKRIMVAKSMFERINGITELDELIKGEWEKYSVQINDFFNKLQCPSDFKRINIEKDTKSSNLEVRVTARNDRDVRDAIALSSGQKAALASAIFWTLNLYSQGVPELMLMDEPIHQVDDVNSLNFLDSLRWIIENKKRQILISTANSRIAGLIRRKFSYLNSDYLELHMERVSGMPTIVNCIGSNGNKFAVISPRQVA